MALFTPITSSSKAFPNPLLKYASYNYILSLSALTKDQINDPDGTYMAGQNTTLICKSGGADPSNRVNVPGFGRFDFFITNLELQSMIGFRDGKNTNVFQVMFEVFEPYSMQLFLLSLQQAANICGFPNFHLAPFLLTIEFKGNTETGLFQSVPNTKKYIPIIINSLDISSSEAGTKYVVNANIHTSFSQSIIYSKIPHEVSIIGKTVQEALQSLETSLQYVINERKIQDSKDTKTEQPDQILIVFPKKLKSAANPLNDSGKAVINNISAQDSKTVFQKLGTSEVSVSGSVNNQVETGEINDIGKASLSFGKTRTGDASVVTYQKVFKEKQMNRAAVTVDEASSTFKFAQGTNIVDIINEVILNSEYAVNALSESAVDSLGNRTWWRIDTQTYYLGKNNVTTTNVPATLTVYRVVPYRIHTSLVTGPGLKPKGIEKLNELIPKVYNYMYTTGSTEILKFDIKYQFGWLKAFIADQGNSSQDDETQNKRSESSSKVNNNKSQIEPSTLGIQRLGTSSSPATINNATRTSTDSNGGTQGDTPAIRMARQYQSLVTNPIDMIELDMEIIGDPFWITSSGMGNYTISPKNGEENSFVNADYSVNFQSGEVYIHVNFRSPVDIDQATGLFKFPKLSTTKGYDSSIMVRGIYRVNFVTSTFRDGVFTQRLVGYRVNNQFELNEATPSQTLNSDTPGPPPPLFN